MDLKKIVAISIVVTIAAPCRFVSAADAPVAGVTTTQTEMPASNPAHEEAKSILIQGKIEPPKTPPLQVVPPRDTMYKIGRDGSGPSGQVMMPGDETGYVAPTSPVLPQQLPPSSGPSIGSSHEPGTGKPVVDPPKTNPVIVDPAHSSIPKADPPNTPKPDPGKPVSPSDLCLNVLGCSGNTISKPDPKSGPAVVTFPPANDATVPIETISMPVVPGPIVDPPKVSPPLEPWQPTPIAGVVFPKAVVQAGDITITSEPKSLTVQFNGSATDRGNDIYTLDLDKGIITVTHYSSGWSQTKPTKSSYTVDIKQGAPFIAALKAMMGHVDSAVQSAKTGQISLYQIKSALFRVYRIAMRSVVVVKDPTVVTPKDTPPTTSFFGNRGNIQGGPAVAPVDNSQV